MRSKKNAYPSRFHRYGGAPHLIIDNISDLKIVPELDLALWVASSAPVSCMNGNPRMLSLVDADQNGKITHDEVVDAVAWVLSALSVHKGIEEQLRSVSRSDINISYPDGKRIDLAMSKIHAQYNTESAGVDLDTIGEVISEIQKRPASGAGVVRPSASEDDETRVLMERIIQVTGGAAHPDGALGVDIACLERYGKAVTAHSDWRKQAPVDIEKIDAGLLEDKIESAALKIDEYFALCALAEAAGPAAAVGNPASIDTGFTGGSTEEIMERVKAAPLAPVEAVGNFDISACTNAFYRETMIGFFSGVVGPLLGRTVSVIHREEWLTLRDRVMSIVTWYKSMPDLADRISSSSDEAPRFEEDIVQKIASIIESSRAAAIDLENVRLLEKLILYQIGIFELVNNFVSFPDLYSRERRAAFERGYLVMDGRRFNLAVIVQDRKTHVLYAKNSSMFVMYISVYLKMAEILFEVAVPVTSGKRGNLTVGKHGIFVDLAGAEMGAVVTEIIENPISVSEAAMSPFKRLGRMVTGKVEAITQESQAQLTSFATGDVNAFAAQQPAAHSAEPKAAGLLSGGGILLGGSVAFAAIGSAIAYITNTLSNLAWWQFLAGIFGAILLVILPATILAVIKLRRRDLSAIVEASGWSVNARMRLTHRLGLRFTTRPDFPKGAKGVPWHRRWRKKLR